MHYLIITLLCSILHASAASHGETHKIIMPEYLQDLLELPNRLMSKNAENFPNLSTIDEKYQKSFCNFRALGTINVHTGPWALKGYPFPVIFFFAKADIVFQNIFLISLPAIHENYPDISTKPQQEQADIVYQWLSTKEIFKDLKKMCTTVQNYVRFSNAPEDRFGRLIINGEEVYRGENQDE